MGKDKGEGRGEKGWGDGDIELAVPVGSGQQGTVRPPQNRGSSQRE